MKLTYRYRCRTSAAPEHIAPFIDGCRVWPVRPEHWTDDVQNAVRRAYVLGWEAAQAAMCRHMVDVDYGIDTTRWENCDGQE